ncbi:pseudouridine synthase [Hymenobacter rigui]|uniref:Pseudouridine synthase n=1 Tax=Hymenobacter rigui TaxID=334424 RepID=A0A428KNG6_9BACT|nr:pseudouridine synthase [Hymenobacter rigui]RSK47980.1 pseudouridine synthase [Hymenobacter rigui]
MGKKHFSGDAPGRKGRSTGSGRPSGNTDGFRKFIQPGQERTERSSGDAPRFGQRSDRDNTRGGGNDRSSFGRSGGGSFGGPKKFGNSGSFGGSRKFGAPTGGGNRDSRSYRGGDDSRRSTEGSREERPIRSFEPRQTWQGQPYRQEGKPAVPRGLPGERNRKFVKQNPTPEEQAARPEAFRPRDTEERPTRSSFTGDREVRPARPFDFRGRPTDLENERPARFEGEDRRERPASREDGFGSERRDFGNRKPQGFGGGASGEKRTSRPGSFGDKREGRSFEKDRRFESPRGTERRDTRSFEERPKRAHDEYVGRGPQTPNANQAGKRKYGEVAGEAPEYKNLKHYEEDKNRGNKRRREEDDVNTGEVRLNRYIANAGICSRREADSLIAAGEIKVNGQVVTEMGYKVQPSDTVQYGKTNLNREKQVYVLLNKPKDYLTTTEDPEGRRTVMELIKGASKERVFPVGRLDRNTTGLLLFTNDGEVAQKLSHPSHRNKKIYQVELDKPLTPEHLAQIADGLTLEDGKAEVDDVAVVAGNPHFVGVEIHIGRNRIVRRIFEHLGYDVVTLDRVQYAGLTKKDLPRGKWRFLTEKEVIRLKYFM